MNKRSKLLIIISGIIIALAAVASFLVPELTKSDTQRIAESISKMYDDSKVTKDEMTEEIKPEEVYLIQEDSRNVAHILKYKNSDDAKARELVEIEKKKYIEEKSINNSIVLSEKYDILKKTFIISSKGQYLLYIDDYYESDKDDLIKKFNEAVKKYDGSNIKEPNLDEANKIKEKMLKIEKDYFDLEMKANSNSYNEAILKKVESLDTCKGNDCKDIYEDVMQYEKYDDLKESVSKLKAKYDLILQKKKSIATNISNRISKLNTSLSQTEYDSVKKEISKLESDDYYKTYITNWNKSLNNIEAKIYKKSAVSLNYKNVLRNPSNYEGKKVYWFGEVVQVVDKGEYRVNVNCEKYYYSNNYYCRDTIYVKYSGSKNLIEDDMVKIWGTMGGNVTYTTVLGAETTVPLVNAKYIDIVG